MNTSKRVPGGLFQPQKLEISPNFSNLKIIEDDNVNSIMGRNIAKGTNPKIIPDTELPSISVIPDPGLCVKTKNLEGTKVFINVCKIEAIPPAKPITEEALQSIIVAEDYNSDFQIPMSLGAPRKVSDYVWELSQMTSVHFWGFLTQPPSCQQLHTINVSTYWGILAPSPF